IGPFYPTMPPPAAVLATRDVLADVARYVGATFLDPIAGNWLDPSLIGPDGIHPTNAGHAAIAARLAAELLKL
ncbi:MAG: lysophospholipase L1-like esterase, partial [Frankiales bacterium]|nr:lysophospholipase L1-like esterase [Frankiales bacterium]